jgi:hypothetical protein
MHERCNALETSYLKQHCSAWSGGELHQRQPSTIGHDAGGITLPN